MPGQRAVVACFHTLPRPLLLSHTSAAMARVLSLSLLLLALVALFVGRCQGDALQDALFRARKCVAQTRPQPASAREQRGRAVARAPRGMCAAVSRKTGCTQRIASERACYAGLALPRQSACCAALSSRASCRYQAGGQITGGAGASRISCIIRCRPHAQCLHVGPLHAMCRS
jgi:hypothetical protein